MPKKTEYCSLVPVFPETAYMLFLFILHKDELIGVIPLDSIYATTAMASEGVIQSVKQFETIDHSITVPEECLLIPLTRKSEYPLKKEFWEKPAISYNSQMRVKTFSSVIEYPSFYSLLVTPYVYDDKTNEWHFSAALPLIDPDDTKTIEHFMITSDHVVEPRAKNAAIYTMGKKLRFNWETKEIKPFDNSANKIIKINN